MAIAYVRDSGLWSVVNSIIILTCSERYFFGLSLYRVIKESTKHIDIYSRYYSGPCGIRPTKDVGRSGRDLSSTAQVKTAHRLIFRSLSA